MQNEALQRAKGVRDFGPAEKIARNEIVETLRSVFELYGYNPIETPVLERYELFASKFGIGQESDAMRETFKLTDQGNRQLVLRTEFTVPFARFVGMNPQLRFPFKRYQMGTVFRDGPIKLGRYREFWQCDVDVVGVSSPTIDAEIMLLANTVFQKLGLDIIIKINSRKVLNKILDFSGVPTEDQISTIISIDKLDKIGEDGVKKELLSKNIDENIADTVLSTIALVGNNIELLEKLENLIGKCEGIDELRTAISLADKFGNIVFTPSLARGLAYYTGNVFEVYLKDQSQISSSICAGGRFDGMIGGFIGDNAKYPAVGISFGLETIFDALKLINSDVTSKRNVSNVYIIPIGESMVSEAMKLAQILRENNISTDVDFLGRKLNKNMEYADSYGIPWVIIVGEDEAKEEKFSIKNMTTGEQEKLTADKIIKKLQK